MEPKLFTCQSQSDGSRSVTLNLSFPAFRNSVAEGVESFKQAQAFRKDLALLLTDREIRGAIEAGPKKESIPCSDMVVLGSWPTRVFGVSRSLQARLVLDTGEFKLERVESCVFGPIGQSIILSRNLTRLWTRPLVKLLANGVTTRSVKERLLANSAPY
jgi:hypothetical protein